MLFSSPSFFDFFYKGGLDKNKENTKKKASINNKKIIADGQNI